MDAVGLLNYVAALALVLYGLYVIMREDNIIRKIIGMAILQTGVILFYVSLSYKKQAQIPILDPHGSEHVADMAAHFANPLPHALMLTAIVVGVSTLGVALVLAVSVYRETRTLEESAVLKEIEKSA